MKYTLSLEKIAYALFIIAVVLYASILSKSILLPFVFAGLFAFLLKPICDRIETILPWRGTAVFLSFVVVLIPLFGLFALFSFQFIDVFQDLPAIGDKLEEGFNNVFLWVNEQIGFTNNTSEDWIKKNSSKLMEAPIGFIGQSISSSTAFLTSLLLCFLYTFFLLLYRSSIKKFVLIQFSEERRVRIEQVLERIQKVIQKYLSGMGIVMLVLAILNSVGLYLIGVEYALLWGFLAAFLAIIPYVGTFLGGLLPFVYAFATSGSYVQPALVVALFGTVQALEGNIITPKIVGSSVKINPLAAIVALVVGGFIWGVAGLILALPIIAVLRIVMGQIDFLKPLSVLLSDDIYGNSEVFEEKFDKEKFRFWHFFKRKKSVRPS